MFNFQGVLDDPELAFDRDGYSQYTHRNSSKSLTNDEIMDDGKGEYIGTIKDDFIGQHEVFIKRNLMY